MVEWSCTCPAHRLKPLTLEEGGVCSPKGGPIWAHTGVTTTMPSLGGRWGLSAKLDNGREHRSQNTCCARSGAGPYRHRLRLAATSQPRPVASCRRHQTAPAEPATASSPGPLPHSHCAAAATPQRPRRQHDGALLLAGCMLAPLELRQPLAEVWLACCLGTYLR